MIQPIVVVWILKLLYRIRAIMILYKYRDPQTRGTGDSLFFIILFYFFFCPAPVSS